MNEIGRQECRQLQAAVKVALKAVETDHNVAVEVAGGRFNDLSATFKVTIHSQRAKGQLTTAETMFNAMALQYGLEPSDLHRKFRSHGKIFEITGLKPSRFKYPINAKQVGGRSGAFKFSVDVVRAGLL